MVAKKEKYPLFFALLMGIAVFALFGCSNSLMEQVIQPRTVTFNSNGGNLVEPQTLWKGELAVRPDDPVKDGCVFTGWYSDAQFKNIYSFSSKVQKNITLHAKWDTVIAGVGITVTRPATGNMPNTAASPSDSADTAKYNVGQVTWSPNNRPFLGETVYTATIGLTAKPGYTFTTGLTSATINGYNAEISDATSTSATVSLEFARTEKKEIQGITIKTQPKLSYKHNDALDLSGLAITINYNDATSTDVAFADFPPNISTVPANGAQLSRSNQAGGFIDNGKTVKVQIGDTTANTAPLTVDKADGAAVTLSSARGAVVSVGSDLLPLKISASAKNESGNGQAVQYNLGIGDNNPAALDESKWQAEGDFIGLETDIRYYVFSRLRENENYTAGAAQAFTVGYEFSKITFDAKGGSTPEAQYVQFCDYVSKPADPIRDRYVFVAWYKESTLDTLWNFASDKVTGSITLYAKWKENHTFEVTFEQIKDEAPLIEGPTLSRSGANSQKTLSVPTPEKYDSIKWEITGTGITGTGATFTLNAKKLQYNQIGDHFLSLKVVKDGIPYSTIIIFKVVP